MNPILAELLRQIVIQAPMLAIELVRLFSQPTITEEQWAELRKRFTKSYDDYIKEAAEKDELK